MLNHKLMMSTPAVIFVTLVALLALAHSSSLEHKNGKNYVREACSVTRYRDICIHSLSSYSSTARRNSSRWARAGVSVTLREANSIAQYLMTSRQHRSMRGRSQVALQDCIECFQDAIDNLHKSLGILRSLNRRAFEREIDDLKTWTSAALTDVDTCLDGFAGQNRNQVKLLRNRVLRATYITSNALALIARLAATG
ncbi:pectinesterase inhibitor 6-like [Malania oleifera]|uniref:pectinesterase inhibitor 6-like n=1 Tax=Malania oleifera TaxID=397392 RepID=UPI0025AE3675|nr:pectinesterase inhibitor 6-like [Malania oleifera]